MEKSERSRFTRSVGRPKTLSHVGPRATPDETQTEEATEPHEQKSKTPVFMRSVGRPSALSPLSILHERPRADPDLSLIEELTEPPISQKTRQILVGALDFGTTYSGWAYSFINGFQRDPTHVTIRPWHSNTPLITDKAPTCILIKPDGQTLEAFGYDAENQYIELVENGKDEGYYFFKRFKMTLNQNLQKGIQRDYTLQTVKGQTLPAMTVFSLAIRYLTHHMLSAVNQTLDCRFYMDDAQWVITVPAIWTNPAKQFMRESAIMAGIDNDKLRLCLEPEAASIHFRYLPFRNDEASISSFPANTVYMVVDAGGGTVDITVHKIRQSGELQEVHAATGGGWGGTLVDQAFDDFLSEVIGAQAYRRFQETEAGDWIDMGRSFELQKRNINPKSDTPCIINIPVSLVEVCQDQTGKSIAESIAASRDSDQIQFRHNKLKLKADLARRLFDNAISKVIAHVKSLINLPNVGTISAILMAGGFSDSPMLHAAFKAEFEPEISVIKPQDAAASILKGAVIFGHNPKCITHRVLKHTYGVHTSVTFQEDKHPTSKRVDYDSGVKCKDVFSKHAEINQSIHVDQVCQEQRYTPVNRSQKSATFDIYASQLKGPQFVDDDGCTKIGQVTVEIPEHKGDMENGVFVSMKFGGTEIEVTGRDEVTGEETKVTVNFLG